LQLYQSLIRILEWKGSWDPQKLADEVINRVCRKIEEGEQIGDIYGFCRAVLNYVFLESLKTPELKLDQLTDKEEILSSMIAPDTVAGDAWMGCFERCLKELPDDVRNMIVGYYQQEKRARIENRKQLAEELHITKRNLEVRAGRVREKLRNCVINCLETG